MSNFNLNKVIIGGRLTSDVELKTTQGGISVCSFSVAVNRRVGKDKPAEVDFINCTAWRATAEFIHRFFGKGSSICVVGSIQTRSWDDQNGQKRYATEVVVDEAMFVDSKSEAQPVATTPTNFVPDAYKPNTPSTFAMDQVDVDQNLPF